MHARIHYPRRHFKFDRPAVTDKHCLPMQIKVPVPKLQQDARKTRILSVTNITNGKTKKQSYRTTIDLGPNQRGCNFYQTHGYRPRRCMLLHDRDLPTARTAPRAAVCAGIQECVVTVVVVEYFRWGPVCTAVTESTSTVRDHRYTHMCACGSHTEHTDETEYLRVVRGLLPTPQHHHHHHHEQ